MSKKKGILALLTGILVAGVTTVSVHAVGLGFSSGYIPLKMTGNDSYTAVREMDDFSPRGSMIAAAVVQGTSLEKGTYYFHVEPVMDDNMMLQFRKECSRYKGMFLRDAQLVDINFCDADGKAVVPAADIYFQGHDFMLYDYAFMYENGHFVPVKSNRMIDTLQVTPTRYSRFVLADYTFQSTATDVAPTPDTTSKPIDVSSKTESRPEQSSEEEQYTSEYLPNSSTTEISQGSEWPDGETTSRVESKEETSEESQKEISYAENSQEEISIPEESGKDISIPENNSMQEISVPDNSGNGTQELSADKTSAVVSQPSQGSIISAPDGTAATGDSHTTAVLAVMGMTAGISTVMALRKKKDRP